MLYIRQVGKRHKTSKNCNSAGAAPEYIIVIGVWKCCSIGNIFEHVICTMLWKLQVKVDKITGIHASNIAQAFAI